MHHCRIAAIRKSPISDGGGIAADGLGHGQPRLHRHVGDNRHGRRTRLALNPGLSGWASIGVLVANWRAAAEPGGQAP